MQNDSVDIKKEIISKEILKRELVKKISVYSVLFSAGLLMGFSGITILAIGVVTATCSVFFGFCSVYEKILDRRIKKVEALIKEDQKYDARRKRFRVINGNGR